MTLAQLRRATYRSQRKYWMDCARWCRSHSLGNDLARECVGHARRYSKMMANIGRR